MTKPKNVNETTRHGRDMGLRIKVKAAKAAEHNCLPGGRKGDKIGKEGGPKRYETKSAETAK